MPFGIQPLRFGKSSLLHHGLYPAIDAAEQFLTLWLQEAQLNVERSLGTDTATHGGIRLSGSADKLYGMYEAFAVVKVYLPIVNGVESFQFGAGPEYTLLIELIESIAANVVRHCGKVVKTPYQRVDIEHGSTAHHRLVVSAQHIGNLFQRPLAPQGGRHVFLHLQYLDKAMRHSFALFKGGNSGDDRHTTVKLPRIGTYHLGAEPQCLFNSKGRLA